MNTEAVDCRAPATVPPLTYTKEVRAAILKAHRIALRFRRTTSWGEGVVEIECFREVSRKGQTTTVATSFGRFECRAFIGNGHMDKTREVMPPLGWTEYSSEEDNLHCPGRGYWGLRYMNQLTHERSIFKLLPLGSDLTFRVRLDYATTPNMAVAGLHGDVLELEVHKGKHSFVLELDREVGKHNTCRFGVER